MHRIILMPIDVTKHTLNGMKLDEDGLKELSVWMKKIDNLNKRVKAKHLPNRTNIKQQRLFGIVFDDDFNDLRLTGFVGFSINDKEHCATLIGYDIFEKLDGEKLGNDYLDGVQSRIEHELSQLGVLRIEFIFYEVNEFMYKLFDRFGFKVTALEMEKVLRQPAKK